jgi:simple sugar transport system permease protein
LIVAVAMTFVITTGGIDLSVGSTVALVNASAAILLQFGIPWPLVIVALLALGACVGAMQGWFVAYEGIPAFIVTLAGLSILRGVALLMTQGFSIPIETEGWFTLIGRGWLLGIPFPAVLGILAALIGFLTLGNLRFGRHVVAIGANLEAARRVGISVKQRLMTVYILTGVASAIAGIIIAARLGSGSSNAAVGFELEVIAAVVLGGTSLLGGKGTIVGTVLGALTIAVIGNGLILAHVSPFFTQIVTGFIILIAIWLNTRVFAKLATPTRKR